jgi:hypothetical protein
MRIERDEWLYVRTNSAARARQFFGVPSDRKVMLESIGPRIPEGLPVWKVKATK